MKQIIIGELTTEEVRDKMAEEAELLLKLKMNHAVSQLENPLQIRYNRRTIARLKTELSKRLRADETSVQDKPKTEDNSGSEKTNNK